MTDDPPLAELAVSIGAFAAFGVAAVMSALSFDFFRIEPYMSLKMSDASRLLVSTLLPVLGLHFGRASPRRP